jgi:hypothetical protein
MNENRSTAGDALISLLKSSINADGGQAFGHMVLYTSFGVVRGRMGYTFAQQLHSEKADSQTTSDHEVIELNDASVEHYSNHLPTATFNRLYVSLSNVKGFALIE